MGTTQSFEEKNGKSAVVASKRKQENRKFCSSALRGPKFSSKIFLHSKQTQS